MSQIKTCPFCGLKQIHYMNCLGLKKIHLRIETDPLKKVYDEAIEDSL